MARRGNGEGSVYRRQDGRWAGVVNRGYEGGRRKRKSFYGKTRREVADRMASALRDTQIGLPLPTDQLTVGAFLDDWLIQVAKPKLRPLTFRSYESIVREHLIPAFGRRRIAKLSPAEVQKYLNAKAADGLSPYTVRNIRAVLRAALAQAQRWGLVAQNVAVLVDTPRIPTDEIEPLSVDEARAAVAAIAGDRLEALYILVLTVGLRQGEALAIRRRDIDFDARTVTIDEALQRYDGSYHLNEPKSRRSHRAIALPDPLVARLRAYRVRQIEERLMAGVRWSGNEADLLFTTEFGLPLNGTTVTHMFQRLLARAGLPHKRFHDLRHPAASFMLAEGVSMRVVMEVLGHSDFSLTANVYSYVAPDLQRQATDRVGRLILGNS